MLLIEFVRTVRFECRKRSESTSRSGGQQAPKQIVRDHALAVDGRALGSSQRAYLDDSILGFLTSQFND